MTTQDLLEAVQHRPLCEDHADMDKNPSSLICNIFKRHYSRPFFKFNVSKFSTAYHLPRNDTKLRNRAFEAVLLKEVCKKALAVDLMELLNKTNKLQILNFKHENKDSTFPETGDAIQSEK